NQSGSDPGREFFYLDFSVSFNTKNLVWVDLTNTNVVPSHFDATAIKGGPKNKTLFLSGRPSRPIYAFDAQNSSWSTPLIVGYDSIRAIGEVINFKGESYKFGGFSDVTNRFTVDMVILNTINLSWRRGSILNAPSARCCYGSALLPNQVIVYFGGYDGTILGLNEAYLYDTINDSWNTRTTSGQIPSNRSSFANFAKRLLVD
ncbi:3924_t:CDS:2, partial [Cetraspora pellucida]